MAERGWGNNPNPYDRAPATESAQGYGQQYEMHPYGQEQAHRQTMTQQEFLAQVSRLQDEIRALSSDVDKVAQLHSRSLTSPDSSVSGSLKNAISQTQLRNTQISDSIRRLEQDFMQTQDGSRTSKMTQLNALKARFRAEIDKFQSSESSYRQRYRDQISRQYRIVNPDAPEEEIRQAADADWGNEGVFQTALRSNRTRQGESVLGAVRARHGELRQIEHTMAELALLFEEMSRLVELQDPVVQAAEANAESTVQNLGKGNEQIKQGIENIKRRNKLRRWCIGVTILIILAAALGIGVGLGLQKKAADAITGNNQG